LVLVEGQATISFIADHTTLRAPAKKMIRRGLFHQTQAISENGIVMLEIETPIDQNDLVRLKDAYGRTGQGYETDQLPSDDECLTINVPVQGVSTYKLGTSSLEVGRAANIDVNALLDSDIIIFLQGGLAKNIDNRLHLVIQPGDVGEAKIVKQVYEEMDGFQPNTELMIVR
jgi:hypothetical protein